MGGADCVCTIKLLSQSDFISVFLIRLMLSPCHTSPLTHMCHIALFPGPQKGIGSGVAESQFPSKRWRMDSACGAADVSVWWGLFLSSGLLWSWSSRLWLLSSIILSFLCAVSFFCFFGEVKFGRRACGFFLLADE